MEILLTDVQSQLQEFIRNVTIDSTSAIYPLCDSVFLNQWDQPEENQSLYIFACSVSGTKTQWSFLATCSVCQTKLSDWAKTSRRPVISAALPGNHRASGTRCKLLLTQLLARKWDSSSNIHVPGNIRWNCERLVTHSFSCVVADKRSLVI